LRCCQLTFDSGLGGSRPTGDPCVTQAPRGIDLEKLAFDLKWPSIQADTSAAPLTANAEIGFVCLATVTAFLTPPLRHLRRINQRLEDSLRFGSNMNFADERILIT
jgi:hypothetical protein